VQHQQTYQQAPQRKRVYTMFVNFKGAYDSISRGDMWKHFRCKIGLPLSLAAIQSLYSSDVCVVQTELNTSPTICQEKGVRQGCLLSPLLFSLFVNDVGQYIDKRHDDGRSAGVSYTSNDTTSHTVSCVMYADDLFGLIPQPEGFKFLWININTIQDPTSSRLLPSSSCSCCIRNLHALVHK
jgi:hypothetical protein